MRGWRVIVAAVRLCARHLCPQGRQLFAEHVHLALQRQDIHLLRREGIAEFTHRVALKRDLGLDNAKARSGVRTAVIRFAGRPRRAGAVVTGAVPG